MHEPEKKLIGDRYRILRSVDEGGTSYIFLVQDVKLNKLLAMKLLKPELSVDSEYVRAFRREIKLLKKLKHPNIAHLVNYGSHGSLSYYLMEYIRGKTLKSHIEQGSLTLEQKLEIAKKICSAMEYAHGAGVVHRDLKPANVVLNEHMEPVILDFGTAEAAEAAEGEKEEVFGTVEYFSPEQARGEKTDKFTDIYSMGILLYELMTGKLPFAAEDKVSLALKQIHQMPESPCVYEPELPHSIERIILKALRKQKNERYHSFAHMYRDLEQALDQPEGDYIQDYRETPDQPKKERRHGKWKRGILAAAGAVFAAVVGAAVLNLVLSVSKREAEAIYMPSLQDKTLEEAKSIIEPYDLELECRYETDEEIEEGRIIYQSPQMGALVERGEQVQAVISLGAGDLLDMPNVIGMDAESAQDALSRVGFIQVEKESVYYANVREGEVVGQYPDSGERVSADATVVISINRTAGQLAEEIPQLVGEDLFTAVPKATNAGFDHVLINLIDMSDSPGQVVSQYPTSDMSEVSLAYMELTAQQPSSTYQLSAEIPGGAVQFEQDAVLYVTAVLERDKVNYEFILEVYTCRDAEDFEHNFGEGKTYRIGLDSDFQESNPMICIYLNGEVVYTK